MILLCAIPEGVACQHILIVYYSGTGHTALLADAVATGARGVAGSDVRLLSVDSVSHDDVAWADALIVGSPVHAANISAPIVKFLASLPLNEMHDKIGAAFVTAGGISAGEETVQLAILRAMLVYNMILVGGPTWTYVSLLPARWPSPANHRLRTLRRQPRSIRSSWRRVRRSGTWVAKVAKLRRGCGGT